MKIGFVKERPDWERRTTLVPSAIQQLTKAGHDVFFEQNAGYLAEYSDEQYLKAGAICVGNPKDVYKNSDIVVKINAPSEDEYKFLHPGLWIAGNFESYKLPQRSEIWKQYHINAIALERLPRLSRVQDIDILSSQNNLAGYKAAVDAIYLQSQAVPLMMTSAGTLAPLKALVLGVGVAGLQAIATLQRAGAQVFASDIRPETEEQISSLGAKFIKFTPQNIEKQLSLSNILITSALSLQGDVPLLVSKELLKIMPVGAVAVDLANGNIEGAKNGTIVNIDNVKLYTNSHLASNVAHSSSFLFSRNMLNLILRWTELRCDVEIWHQICLCQFTEE